MKRITLFLLLLFAYSGMAQIKSTGTVQLLNNTTASLDLDSSTSLATLTLTGPSDRWFALQIGSFSEGDGMMAGADLVYWNNVVLKDARHNGLGVPPTDDDSNNWTTVTSIPNAPAAGFVTIIATRPFVGDANDFTFDYDANSIDFAFARRGNPGFTLQAHGGLANAGYAVNTPLTGLGVEDVSLNASQISPNPARGHFIIKAKTNVDRVNVYTHTGAFIKTIEPGPGATEMKVSVEGLQTGIYMIELQNASEKSWKKVIIE